MLAHIPPTLTHVGFVVSAVWPAFILLLLGHHFIILKHHLRHLILGEDGREEKEKACIKRYLIDTVGCLFEALKLHRTFSSP